MANFCTLVDNNAPPNQPMLRHRRSHNGSWCEDSGDALKLWNGKVWIAVKTLGKVWIAVKALDRVSRFFLAETLG